MELWGWVVRGRVEISYVNNIIMQHVWKFFLLYGLRSSRIVLGCAPYAGHRRSDVFVVIGSPSHRGNDVRVRSGTETKTEGRMKSN